MAYRKFDTQTWQDKRFEKLSPMERYLFIYLWTNDLCNQAGLYEITLRRIEFDTRIPSREVEPLLKGLSGLVEWWSTDEVIFVKNFLKRQCQNKQFAESALAIVSEKFPKYMQAFVKANKSILEKYGIEPPEIPPEGVQPPLNPPSPSTEAVTEAVTETDTEKTSCVELCESSTRECENENPVICIPLVTKDKSSGDPIEFPLYQTQIDEFEAAYPAVDVLQELRNIRAWNIANPKKRKTKTGVMRHINTWLADKQDRGGNGRHPPPAKSNGAKNQHLKGENFDPDKYTGTNPDDIPWLGEG